MNRRSIASTVAGLAAVVIVAGACSSAAPAPTAAPRASDAQKPAATAGSTPVMLGDIADMLVLREAKPTANAAYSVIEPGGGRVLIEIADGVVSHDWHTLVSLAADAGSTRVQVSTPEGGAMPVQVSVPGAWRLATVGVAKEATGLSSDGSMLVLEEAVGTPPPGPSARTRFAIVSTAGSKAPRIVTLPGSFVFDVLSPDGRWLYLLEYVGGGDPTHYQVRRFDVAAGTLMDGTIVDKRNIDEQMNGYALTQVVGRNGMVYTLYRGPEGAFIHALDTTQGGAFCIDLPGTEDESPDTNGDWGLVADPSGAFLYVTDPAERRVSAIDLVDFSITRTATIAMVPTIQYAKLESAQPAGGRATLSADGKALYVIGKTGVAVIRVADLVTTGHLGGSTTYRSVAAGSAGAVYAIDDRGHAMQLRPDGATSVANGEYASIVGLVPMR